MAAADCHPAVYPTTRRSDVASMGQRSRKRCCCSAPVETLNYPTRKLGFLGFFFRCCCFRHTARVFSPSLTRFTLSSLVPHIGGFHFTLAKRTVLCVFNRLSFYETSPSYFSHFWFENVVEIHTWLVVCCCRVAKLSSISLQHYVLRIRIHRGFPPNLVPRSIVQRVSCS